MAVIRWRGILAQITMSLLASSPAPALAGGAGPPPLEPAQVEAGGVVYQQFCASCHGAQGEGAPNWQEPNAEGDMPAPPHNADGHTWKHSDAMLYEMVAEGWRDPFNKTEQLTMPAFKGQLSPEQIRDIVTYLKTLWTPEQRQFQWEETLVRGALPESGAASQTQPDKDSKSNDLN